MRPIEGCAAIVLGVAPLASGQGRDVTPEFVLPAGLKVVEWAAAPQLFNPTNLDVDARGRVWVTEAVNYRRFNTAKEGRLARPEGDRVVILEDTDGDGVCDASKVFVQDPELVAPLGIAVFGPADGPREVYVACSPHLFKYVDRDGDDVADGRELFLTGFGGFDHDHGLHALVAGPDGRFYFNAGNAGPHVVRDLAGFTLRAGSVYSGGTPHEEKNGPNAGGMVSDDGRVWVGGLALSIAPDGTGLTPLAHNFRNSYEVAIDSFGDLWQNDNDDERQACRVTWLPRGANQGFASADGRRSWQADQRPGQSVLTAHWHQDDPGVMPCGDVTGAGAPTGIVVYESDALGPGLAGALLSCDAGRNQIFSYQPRLEGGGFALERSVFLSSLPGSTEKYEWNKTSSDPRTWFRPSDVAVGLDGALYVADWSDPIVGGHAMHDDAGGGRVLRIARKDADPAAAQRLVADVTTLSGKVAALRSPAINVRYAGFSGFRQLDAMGTPAVAALTELAENGRPWERARALWLLAGMGKLAPALLTAALFADDPRFRILAWRLRPPKEVAGELPLWRRMVRDPSLAVRGEVARSLRGRPFLETGELLLALAESAGGTIGATIDRAFLEAFGLACEGHEAELWPMLEARLGAPPLEWSPRFAALVWRLHPPAAAEGLLARALAPDLPLAARRQAVDALAFVPDARAADALQSVATEGPLDLRPLASYWADLLGARGSKPDRAAADPRSIARAQALAERDRMVAAGTAAGTRTQIAAALAEDPDGALVLIEMAARGQLPAELRATIAQRIFRNPDLAVRALASEQFRRETDAGVPLPTVAELAAMTGDVARGRTVFVADRAGCSKCHLFAGSGGDVGPDLTAIRGKYGRPELFDAILHPNGAIALGYDTWILELRSGELLTGFVLAEGESLVLKDTAGSKQTIPVADIVARRKSKLSVMPDNVALGLTVQELADLVEFLRKG